MLLYNPMIQHSNKLLHSNRYNKLLYSNMLLHPVINHEQGDRLPAAGGPPPMRTPGAARRTPRQLSKTMNFVLLYCVFFCFAICVIDICLSEDQQAARTRIGCIHDIHVFFLYVIIYCPLPHQSLWERLGVSLSCTCVAFSLYAKLNWFFWKKNKRLPHTEDQKHC